MTYDQAVRDWESSTKETMTEAERALALSFYCYGSIVSIEHELVKLEDNLGVKHGK